MPQLLYKGRILLDWNKKLAVAIQDSFYATLPELPQVPAQEADIAWFIYALEYDSAHKVYSLVRSRVVYTSFNAALAEITTPRAGEMGEFVSRLRKKLQREEHIYPPVTVSLLGQKESDVS